MMMLTDLKIHHIGYLVKHIERSMEVFVALGYYKASNIIYDENRGVDIVFLEKDGYIVELVSPKTENSVVRDLYSKIGNSPYHICYEVEDIDKAVTELRKQKFVVCSEACPAPALDNRDAVFLINGKIGMIELVEKY